MRGTLILTALLVSTASAHSAAMYVIGYAYLAGLAVLLPAAIAGHALGVREAFRSDPVPGRRRLTAVAGSQAGAMLLLGPLAGFRVLATAGRLLEAVWLLVGAGLLVRMLVARARARRPRRG